MSLCSHPVTTKGCEFALHFILTDVSVALAQQESDLIYPLGSNIYDKYIIIIKKMIQNYILKETIN